MKTIRVCELEGKALEYAVALCEGLIIGDELDVGFIIEGGYLPSAVWQQGGPIIEREGINPRTLKGWAGRMKWQADYNDNGKFYYGETALIAAMRYYVASKLGNVVELPAELF